MAAQSSSVKQLSREAEVTRERLANSVVELNEKVSRTIDDVVVRISPSNIKKEVKGYIREESADIFESVQRRARENPLQAVAIGAALTYPVWGILKAIPIPILLIGGGIFLSKQNTSKISDTATEKAKDLVQSAKESVARKVDVVSSAVQEATQSALDRTITTANETVDTVKGATSTAVDDVSATVSDLADSGVRAASRTRGAVSDLIYENPLVVGGVALAIGAFIAASIPISNAENNLLGEARDSLKDKARNAVSDGIKRTQNAAADIGDRVATAINGEGVSTENLSKAIEGATGAVKAVVERGLTTALGETGKNTGSSHESPTNQN